jgi:multiple sugar transport system substrate-binding protein
MICGGANAFADDLAFAQDKPIYKVGFEALAAEAQAKTGLKLRLDTYQPEDKFVAFIQASVAADSLPPFFSWWNGTSLHDIVASGRVAPLDDFWNAAVKEGNFAPETGDLLTVDGHMYGIPLGYGHWVALYNKKLFAKAGISGPPATWQEFLDDAAKLKASGITPISATIQSGWRAFIWFQEIMLRTDPDAFRGLFTGKTSYDGPAVRNAFKIWGDLYAKGYMTDPRSQQDIVDYASGKGAIYLMGDWSIGPVENAGLKDDDLGVFIMPLINPQAQDCIIVEEGPILVPKTAINRPEVQTMIKFLLSADAANVLRDKQGLYVGNLKSTPRSHLMGDEAAQIAARKPVVVARWWESTPVELQNDLVAEFGKFMLDPTPATADKAMANMQSLNRGYWDSH